MQNLGMAFLHEEEEESMKLLQNAHTTSKFILVLYTALFGL